MLVLAPPPAAAGTISCVYDDSTKTVTATATADLSGVIIGRDGDEIDASGTDCGAATRFNTDTIVVNDVPSHNLTVFILLTEGPLRPGATAEPGSSDEIEIEVNLGTGQNTFTPRGGRIMRAGTTVTGTFTFERQVNLNAGESTGIDHDVVVTGALEKIFLQGTDFDDSLSAAGGAGTGSVYLEEVHITGWDEGRDSLRGGGVDDILLGEKGADTLRGGAGEDKLEAAAGRDTLRGNSGDDELSGSGGNDHLDGGPGTDQCDAGSGTNTVTGCE